MDFLVLDTETGGLTPGRHSLLEVGLAAYTQGEIIDTKRIYIKEKEYVVSPKAMEINKLDVAEVARLGVEPIVAMDMIINFIQKNFSTPPTILGHNPSFDRNFVKALFTRFGEDIDATISYRTFDTATLIQTAIVLGKLPIDFPRSLHKVRDALGVTTKIEEDHTAMGDIMTTIAVYETLIALLGGHQHGK